MPVKIWLPWKRQVTWTVTCHIKLLPDKFWKKSPSLVAFASILKKLLTSKVAAGRIRGQNFLQEALSKVHFKDRKLALQKNKKNAGEFCLL